MTERASAIVQHKRMTREEWMDSHYIPVISELVYEKDTGFYKAGDGIHRFADLKYMTGPKGDKGEKGDQGVPGPPGRDGVVTFENLSQEQRNSLKGDKGERGADGERGHSLNASVRIEGSYKNNATSQLNLFVYVYFDGKEVTNEVLVNGFYRGFDSNNFQVLDIPSVDTDGKIYTWNAAQRSGEFLEVAVEVMYRGLKTIAFARIDNVNDGTRGEQGNRGADGNTIINQRTGQSMKYWLGSQSEFDAISNKDANTIYDIKEQ